MGIVPRGESIMDKIAKVEIGAWNIPMWVKYKDPYVKGDVEYPNWRTLGRMLPFSPNEKGQTVGFSLFLDGQVPMEMDFDTGLIKPVQLKTFDMSTDKKNGKAAKSVGASKFEKARQGVIETPFDE